MLLSVIKLCCVLFLVLLLSRLFPDRINSSATYDSGSVQPDQGVL